MCVNLFKPSTHICPEYYSWAGVLGLLYLLSWGAALKTYTEYVRSIWEGCRHYLSTAGLPFVVCDGFKSSPHVSSVGALVVGLHFVPVLSLSTANSFPERVPGLPVLLQITWVVGVAALSFARTFPLTQGFWFRNVRTVNLDTTSSMHLPM